MFRNRVTSECQRRSALDTIYTWGFSAASTFSRRSVILLFLYYSRQSLLPHNLHVHVLHMLLQHRSVGICCEVIDGHCEADQGYGKGVSFTIVN